MDPIEEILQDLTKLAKDYATDVIDNDEIKLQIQLTISKIDKIAISFDALPLKIVLKRRHTKPFNQLLFRCKYKASNSLNLLNQLTNKEKFLSCLNDILLEGLYFNSLYATLNNSCRAYIIKNQLSDKANNHEQFFKYDLRAYN